MWVCGLKHEFVKERDAVLGSHPAWVCGLKLLHRGERVLLAVSHPAGVWIETYPRAGGHSLWTSHFAWVCGLKHDGIRLIAYCAQSHPAWVCGLKQVRQDRGQQGSLSHPCGVWIEINRSYRRQLVGGHTCVGVWIETTSA